MQHAPGALLMVRVPLLISAAIYAALGWYLPSTGILTAGGTGPNLFADAFPVLCYLLAAAALCVGCICHIPKPPVFWTLFAVALLYTPSAFFFLGIPMLVALLKKEVQDYFGVEFKKSSRHVSP